MSVYYKLDGQEFWVIHGKERAEWEDFFEKLLNNKLIRIDGNNYRLKKAAFDFVEKYTKKSNE